VADPFVAALHPIPKLALLPLFMVLLGVGEAPKVFLVAVAAFFPMLINTTAGVRQINPMHFDLARNYGAGMVRVLGRVVLPGSLPLILAGFRLSANLALVITIAVEMISSEVGLGALVWLSWQLLRVELLYATLVVTALLGIGLSFSLERLERRLAPWRPQTIP
jgi:NitT/TauT family transport system permease protein